MRKKGFQIIKPVFEAFAGLPQKLSNLFGKSDDWYRSHSYATRKDDPLANGNLSAVDHILRMADEYEAAAPGAGYLLLESIGAEGRGRYSDAPVPCSDRDLRRSLNKEFFEAIEELDKKDLSDQSLMELAKTEAELAQIETVIGHARAHVRAEMKRKGVKN